MIIIINNLINILIWYIDHTIIQMIEDAYLDAKTFGNSLLLLERYFLSVPALIRLNEYPPLQLSFPDRMHLQRVKTANGGVLLAFLVKACRKILEFIGIHRLLKHVNFLLLSIK